MMKIEIGRTIADEVITSRLVLKFESGLLLMTDSFLFASRGQKEKIRDEFKSVVQQLEDLGATVTGKERIIL